MKYRIASGDDTLGFVSLDSQGAIAISGDKDAQRRVGGLLDSMRQTRIGHAMTDRQLFKSLPDRLNNGYISCTPEE